MTKLIAVLARPTTRKRPNCASEVLPDDALDPVITPVSLAGRFRRERASRPCYQSIVSALRRRSCCFRPVRSATHRSRAQAKQVQLGMRVRTNAIFLPSGDHRSFRRWERRRSGVVGPTRLHERCKCFPRSASAIPFPSGDQSGSRPLVILLADPPCRNGEDGFRSVAPLLTLEHDRSAVGRPGRSEVSVGVLRQFRFVCGGRVETTTMAELSDTGGKPPTNSAHGRPGVACPLCEFARHDARLMPSGDPAVSESRRLLPCHAA